MNLHTVKSVHCKVHVGLDSESAEHWAMLGAMFSRTTEGVESLIERVGEGDSPTFMSKFYVGYGHESIGDLVDVKLFIEGIPFYVAFMLEHYSQFRGQESSTRYIDFSKQPSAITANSGLYNAQIDRYIKATELVSENLKSAINPKTPSEERAVAARTYDICRGLLPWGATTNVAWYGDIRSISQQLARLSADVSVLGKLILPYVNQIHKALGEVYPSSVRPLAEVRFADKYGATSYTGKPLLQGTLDFGSLRDLNRHRVGRHCVDLNSPSTGLHEWYTHMLLAHGIEAGENTQTSPDHFLLGQEVSYAYIADLAQGAYIARLRSSPSVHPTLRQQVQCQLATYEGLNTAPDPGPFGAIMVRGDQTILLK